MVITGTSFAIEGIISTDDILPAKFKHMFVSPDDFGKYIFSNLIPDFAKSKPKNMIIVGDKIFGISSSREQAVTAMKSQGVKAIIAPEFGRIFYRNCWNNGLPAIHLANLRIPERTELEMDLKKGVLVVDNDHIQFSKPSTMQLDLFRHGNLLNLYKNQN